MTSPDEIHNAALEEWQKPYRSMDQSGSGDAVAAVGSDWINRLAEAEARDAPPFSLSIESSPFFGGGGVTALYRGTDLLAVATIFRDQMNFAVLVRWKAAKSTPAPTPADQAVREGASEIDLDAEVAAMDKWFSEEHDGHIPCTNDAFREALGRGIVFGRRTMLQEAYEEYLALRDQLTAALARVEEMGEALEQARDWFLEYADAHSAKANNPAAHYKDAEAYRAKADCNYDRAQFCNDRARAALAGDEK